MEGGDLPFLCVLSSCLLPACLPYSAVGMPTVCSAWCDCHLFLLPTTVYTLWRRRKKTCHAICACKEAGTLLFLRKDLLAMYALVKGNMKERRKPSPSTKKDKLSQPLRTLTKGKKGVVWRPNTYFLCLCVACTIILFSICLSFFTCALL